jgi:hypothetical protein
MRCIQQIDACTRAKRCASHAAEGARREILLGTPLE